MKRLLIILFLPLISYAQPGLDRKKSDSLWSVWQNNTLSDTARLKAINNYAWDGYLFTYPESAFYYAELQYHFAETSGEDRYKAIALNTQGASYYLRSNYDSALFYYNKSLLSYEASSDRSGMAKTLNNIALIYKHKGDYDQAIDFNMQSLKIKKETGDKNGMASSLNNIGNLYYQQGDFARAIDHYTQSLKIMEETEDKRGMSSAYGNIGNIYLSQNEFPKAIEYYSKSLEISEEIGDKQGVANSLDNIGIVYFKQGDLSKAMENYNLGLSVSEQTGDKKMISSIYNNIAMIYYRKGELERDSCECKDDGGNYKLALEYFRKSLEMREEIGDKKGEAASLTNIGEIYVDMGKYGDAINMGTKAISIADESGFKIEQQFAAKVLYEGYKFTGRYRDALEMYELFISIRDSIQSEENKKEVIRQEYEYEYEKQAAADSIKAVEEKRVTDAQLEASRAQLEKERLKSYSLYGGLGLLLVFGGFMYNRFRLTRSQKDVIELQKDEVERQKEMLEEKNREILDSIHYARRIQEAILPSMQAMNVALKDGFVLYRPKDVVAGDFYWMEHIDNSVYFAAADCTGHGVPGAMVSVVCSNALSKALLEDGIRDPGRLLDRTRELVIDRLAKSGEEMNDGMDIALVAIEWPAVNTDNDLNPPATNSDRDRNPLRVKYAGAHNPMWIVRKGTNKIEEIKADKQPIGKYSHAKPFTTHQVSISQDDCIYVFTDGYRDQFGGEKGKKFKTGRLMQLILNNYNRQMEDQRELFELEFDKWRGNHEQIDDVCVIGVRI